MNEINKFYELADAKFETNKPYRRNKTRQDFIKMMRDHFDSNVTPSKQVKYDNQMVDIKDLINDWETLIDTYQERLSLNSFSNLKSVLVIISSILASLFIGSQKVNYADGNFINLFITALMLIVGIFLIFMAIDFLERYFQTDIIYEKTFYSLCLKILQDYK